MPSPSSSLVVDRREAGAGRTAPCRCPRVASCRRRARRRRSSARSRPSAVAAERDAAEADARRRRAGAARRGCRPSQRPWRHRGAGAGAVRRRRCSLRGCGAARLGEARRRASAASCVEPGRPVLPADERRGERAQAEGAGDQAGGDRARETEVAERGGPRRARRHGVSGVSVRHCLASPSMGTCRQVVRGPLALLGEIDPAEAIFGRTFEHRRERAANSPLSTLRIRPEIWTSV